jgi:hypothetical protein
MLIAKQEHIMADDKLINTLAWCKRERELAYDLHSQTSDQQARKR